MPLADGKSKVIARFCKKTEATSLLNKEMLNNNFSA
jgi:hypothetical protein